VRAGVHEGTVVAPVPAAGIRIAAVILKDRRGYVGADDTRGTWVMCTALEQPFTEAPTSAELASRALADLHHEYRSTRDSGLQTQLVERYQRLAFRLARRAAKREDEVDDLSQVAMIGLVKALWRYDPERGISFTTFAWSTIAGELKRHRRDHAWTLHVSRALQERYLRTSAAIEELTHQLGRSPTLPQVATHLKESLEAVIEAVSVRDAQTPASLDITPSDDNPHQEPADPAQPGDEVEERAEVEALLSRLSDRERDIVQLRFFRDLTQREIGEKLGLSQMHVSRLLARSLDQMREWAAE